MASINNGHVIKKDATKIAFCNSWKKVHDANDFPDKKTDNDTDTDTDVSRYSDSANVPDVIIDTTVILQEGVHDGKSDEHDIISAFCFFSAYHEPMNPENKHHKLERQSVLLSQKI